MAGIAEDLLSHQVDILYDFNRICTGTILSSYMIVTLASCLVGRSQVKITIKTQPKTRSETEEQEDEYADEETRYIDSFYSVRAAGQNGSSDSDLAVILLDEKLIWSDNVKKANLPGLNEAYSKIYQPYRCFDSADLEEMTVEVKESAYRDCMKDSRNSPLFPADCISGTPRRGLNNFQCKVPASGSGLFCESEDEKRYLCGILLSSAPSADRTTNHPLYINMIHYLHGFYLEQLQEETEGDENAEQHGLGATSVGGRAVDFNIEPTPYQLSLERTYGGNWHHSCGAILLDKRTALTAAHCFDGRRNVTIWRVVAGRRQVGGAEHTVQILTVKNIIPHEKWKSIMRGDDIALVVVNGAFVLNEDVQPIWISSPDDPVLSDFNGTATGWGHASNSDQRSGQVTKDLMAVDMPILHLDTCRSKIESWKESILCTHTGTSAVCGGDSGSPFVIKDYEFPDSNRRRDLLVGVVSFAASTCGDLSKPNGFTKVSSHYEWIIRKWKRNTHANETAGNRFVCFNGQEIDGDWRCDEDSDCDDGSDEKGCNIKQTRDKDRPKTLRCGGEIRLSDEHDIIYRVGNYKTSKISQCVWTIYSTKDNPIELTLLADIDAQFDPAQSQLIALSNFTRHHFYYKNINQIGHKRKIDDTYTVLIFRGPTGIQDSGFHLRLKSVRKTSGQEKDNPLTFKRDDLTPNLSPQSYSYPASGFYGANERIFTVLSPSKKGGKISLNVTFGGMEPQRDWFDIISIEKQPKSLFRLSETRGRMNQRVEGGRDEVILVYMNTASPAVRRKGIQFIYQEQQPQNKLAGIPQQKISCGGNVTVDGDQNLVYMAKSSKSNCMWVVSNVRGGASIISLVNSRNPLFNTADSSLVILHNFKPRRNSASYQINEFGRDYLVDQPFFVLYFRASPFSTTSGFFLRLRHASSNSSVTPNLQLVNLNPSLNQTQEFSYPLDGLQNSNSISDSNSSDSAVIIVQPTRDDRKVHLNLTQTHLTDLNEEWLELLTFRDQSISLYRTSRSRSMSDKTFVGSEGEPLIIYLKSKSKEEKSLKFSYSEQAEQVKQTRSCGGVINLERRHEILYTAPPGHRSHCLWVVHNAYGSHSNVTARFDTDNSQLLMLQDKISTQLKREQTMRTEAPVTALLFQSNGSADAAKSQLQISLNDVGGYGRGRGRGFQDGQNSLDARTIVLQSTSQRVKAFKYPPRTALTYANNERVFILITREQNAGNGKRVQLNLTSVDTEPNFDRLEIYSLRRSQGKDANLQLEFEFDGLGSWTNKTYTADSDEPFLLFFHSDSSTTKSGFKLNYSTVA